jgi:hypothetical protein
VAPRLRFASLTRHLRTLLHSNSSRLGNLPPHPTTILSQQCIKVSRIISDGDHFLHSAACSLPRHQCRHSPLHLCWVFRATRPCRRLLSCMDRLSWSLAPLSPPRLLHNCDKLMLIACILAYLSTFDFASELFLVIQLAASLSFPRSRLIYSFFSLLSQNDNDKSVAWAKVSIYRASALPLRSTCILYSSHSPTCRLCSYCTYT